MRTCSRSRAHSHPRCPASTTSAGDDKMKKIAQFVFAIGCCLAFAPAAFAGSAYDGSWNLVFATRQGACDQSYDFVVNISSGIVTHPNLVRFRGRVAKNGDV